MPDVTLTTARTLPEILEAVARFEWWEDGRREGEPEIPTAEDLAETATGAAEAESADLRVAAMDPPPPEEMPPGFLDRVREAALGLSGEDLHRLWCAIPADKRPAHFLAPLVRAWWDRPIPVARETREDALFPASLIHVRRDDPRADDLFPGAWFSRPGAGDQFDLFPGFGENLAHGPVEPALPLALYEMGGNRPKSRGPAPLAARIFCEAVVSVMQRDRGAATDHPVLLPAMTMRDFLGTLYDNPGFYKPSQDFGRIMAACEDLERPGTRIPWQDPTTGKGGLRRVVWAVDVPRDGHRDDVIRFAVHLPPGATERGVIWDRAIMRTSGARSFVAWRLAGNLAAWWHRPGELVRPLEKGGKWLQSVRAEDYPEVDDVALKALTFPAGDAYRHASSAAEKALDYLVEIGYVVVAPRRRIMPGPKWIGWPEGVDRARLGS